jgi:hypothetical protein
MAVLSERQQLAKSLATEIDKMDGAWVTSPLPLDEHAKLRVQIKDIARNEIIQLLKDWGWNPILVSVLPRICATGLIGACLYEIDLPRRGQEIPQDRAIPRDEVNKRGKDPEIIKTYQSVYGKQKR